MSKRNIFLTLFSFCGLSLFAQSKTEFNSEAITQILNQYVNDATPGLAVGIVKDGQVVYEYYRGLANLEHKVQYDKHTRSNIASTAKQFTALMILQMSMEGELDLEDDIRQYLPSLYTEEKEEIKIRHLLNHTSGIRDYVFLLEMKNEAFWTQLGMDNDDVIELLEKQEELVFQPGSQYLYSNSGYTILAKIIEQVSGRSFIDYSKSFFEQLGMNHTSFVRRYMGVIPNRADSYSDWGDGNWLATPAVTKFSGDGFLYTTLRDQLIFEQAVQNAALYNNDLLIKSQQPIPNSEIQSYGYGLELDGRLGRNAQYHSGSTFGYHSHTTRFPNDKLSVFVMSNNGKIWSGTIADQIASVLLPDTNPKVEYDSRLNDGSNQTEETALAGQYTGPSGNLIRVVSEGGQLLWKEKNWSPYKIIEEKQGIYAVDYNSQIKIRFYENELVRFYPTGKTITYQKLSSVPASETDIEGFIGTYESRELNMSFDIRRSGRNQLTIKFSNRDREREIEIFNRNELLASNFSMKVERGPFGRPMDILVSLNDRARNNRFRKKSNLKFQPNITIEGGSLQVTNIGKGNGSTADILLTKNDSSGNEIWSKRYGGSSYDKANSIVSTEDGYLIIGSTSSYGNGNYDMFVIKIDKGGHKQWQNTYGGFYNEYGNIAEETPDGYLIKGTKQYCTSNTDINRECTTNVWFVSIDKNGKQLSNQLLEEL